MGESVKGQAGERETFLDTPPPYYGAIYAFANYRHSRAQRRSNREKLKTKFLT